MSPPSSRSKNKQRSTCHMLSRWFHGVMFQSKVLLNTMHVQNVSEMRAIPIKFSIIVQDYHYSILKCQRSVRCHVPHFRWWVVKVTNSWWRCCKSDEQLVALLRHVFIRWVRKHFTYVSIYSLIECPYTSNMLPLLRIFVSVPCPCFEVQDRVPAVTLPMASLLIPLCLLECSDAHHSEEGPN
jgi:hypothetical protein